MSTEPSQRGEPVSDSSAPVPVVEEDDINFIGKYLYSWITPLFSRGWDAYYDGRTLEDKDLFHLPQDEAAEEQYEIFKQNWSEEIIRVREARTAAASPEEAALIQPKLFRVLMKCNSTNMIVSGVLRVIADGCGIASPFLLREVVLWLGYTVFAPSKVNSYDGFIWAVALGLNCMVMSIANNACMFHVQKAFCNMRTVTALAVYDKSLKLDAQHGLTGLISQMHASDAYKFIEMSIFFHQIWIAPFIIIAALIALYYFIGWAGVLALGVIMFSVPFQGFIAKSMMTIRAECSKRADKRINAINEIMQGIRIVKFMGWEDQFEQRVEEARQGEVALFGRLFAVRSVMVVMITFLPSVVSYFVFAVAYKGFDFNINPQSVFPALSMLNVLRMPLAMLPMGIGKLVDLQVGISRITDFLQREDVEPQITSTNNVEDPAAIEMKNVTVQYRVEEGAAIPNASQVVLKNYRVETLMENINLVVPRGKLTLIVGATGCGKSTLINTMIGENLLTPESEVIVNGKTAFLTQEAWIMNATVRDNILMGEPYDEERYLNVLNDCQLIADLQQLAASDMTEIGERGVNISGGQKQRLAFARAAYSSRDIVLMDDPLSAVDSHVCVALFEDCIMSNLQGRTRVLVTHQVQFLPLADNIIVLDRCQVVFSGSYEDLQKSTVDVVNILAEASPQTASEKKRDQPPPETPAETPAEGNSGTQHDEHKRIRATEIPPPDKEELQRLMTIEKQVQGNISGGVISWYFYIQHPVLVFLAFFFFVLWRAVSVTSDMMVSWWSSRTDVAGYSLTQDEYLKWYGIFLAITGACLFLRQIPFVMSMVKAAKVSNAQMVHRLLHAPTSFFDTTPTGRVISRFSKDMETMDLTIPESLNFFYNLVLVILGAVAIMCYSAPYLVIVIVVMAIVFVFLFKFYTTTNTAQKRLEATNRSPMSSVLNETLGGLPTIRAYGMSVAFALKHLQRVTLSNRSVYSWRNSQRWLSIRVDAISSAIVMATALLTCGLIVGYDRAQQLEILPVMSLAVTYAVSIGGAFGYLTTMTADLESAMSSVERVKEYCDELPQEADFEYNEDHPAPEESWPSSGAVAFKNVSLRYRDGLPLVLKSVTVDITAGHKVGIVGRTGSGKSTIMLALFRMIELAEGAIEIDGVNIAHLKMHDLRSKITIIPQDPLLFQGSIRSNLDPFFLSSDEEVWKVLDKVNMRERVERDGVGLDCPVAERGANFSVGQRQLLCLARALLKGCKVLLLDEATASVDFDADAMIQRTIRTEFKDCTVLTIAHRLATVIDSDRVLLLDHGEVKEFDHPGNLVQQDNSKFRAMIQRLGEEQYEDLKRIAIAKLNGTSSPK